MFREENASFGMSAAEEKQRNRDVVKGTALSFAVVCALIRLCKSQFSASPTTPHASSKVIHCVLLFPSSSHSAGSSQHCLSPIDRVNVRQINVQINPSNITKTINLWVQAGWMVNNIYFVDIAFIMTNHTQIEHIPSSSCVTYISRTCAISIIAIRISEGSCVHFVFKDE